MDKLSCHIFKHIVMKKYIKLLIIPISLLLANCTSSENSAANSQSGTDSAQVDSSATSGQGQQSMKADTPITNGQRAITKDSN